MPPTGTHLRLLRRRLLLAAGLLLLGCQGPPARFAVIDLYTATEVARDCTLIEVVAQDTPEGPESSRSVRWEIPTRGSPAPPSLEASAVLVVAPTPALGYRSAAALARTGNFKVRLVILDSDLERRLLFANARKREEHPSDTDS